MSYGRVINGGERKTKGVAAHEGKLEGFRNMKQSRDAVAQQVLGAGMARGDLGVTRDMPLFKGVKGGKPVK